MKLYGNLNNRLEEGKNYNEDKLIHEGDDVTMYYYTDCKCYYVTRVINQKHIFVKEYKVIGKGNEMGHQDWEYVKDNSTSEEEWIYRNNSWKQAIRWSQKKLNETITKLGYCLETFTDTEQSKLNNGEEIYKYKKLQPISFGIKNYYYDWSF